VGVSGGAGVLWGKVQNLPGSPDNLGRALDGYTDSFLIVFRNGKFVKIHLLYVDEAKR